MKHNIDLPTAYVNKTPEYKYKSKNIIDELVLYQCPVFIGEAGISSCETKANMLKNEYINIDSVKIFANDVRISYKFKRK